MVAAADNVAVALRQFAALRDLLLRPDTQTRAEFHRYQRVLFRMVMNYQVVSEIATRAVVRFGSSLTNVITGTTI